MKIKLKSLISFLALTFCFCLVIGVGYTVARYAGVFDVGEFNLTLEGGQEPLYTIVYHTFNGSTDVVLSKVDYYEEETISMRGVPGTVSGDSYNKTSLNFLGWSPQGTWADDENSQFSKDTSTTANYQPDTRILYKTGDTVALSTLAEFSGKEIHLYDIYSNYYVTISRAAWTAITVEDIMFVVKDTNENRLYDRAYLYTEAITDRYTDRNVRSGEKCNGYGLVQGSEKKTWYHYVHPGLELYLFNTGTRYNSAWGYYDTIIGYNSDTVTGATTIKEVTMPAGTGYFKIGTTKVGDVREEDKQCLAPGTLITMADGTKKEIQHVTYDDKLLVWDSFEGKYVVVPAALIVNHGFGEYAVIEMKFDDGTTIKAIGAHAFLDADTNAWELINANNVQDYLGHSFVRTDSDGYTTVKLIDCKVYEEYTESYTIVSAGHYNFIAENLFSITNAFHPFVGGLTFGADWTYDAEMLRQDIETYGLYTYDDFRDYITEEQFVAFSGEFLKISVEKGYLTFESILRLIEEYLYE